QKLAAGSQRPSVASAEAGGRRTNEFSSAESQSIPFKTNSCRLSKLTILCESWMQGLRDCPDPQFIRRNAMSRFASFSVAIVLAAAYAFADTPTAPPKMTFRSFAPETKIATSDKVTPYRSEDIVLVVIKDSLRCG